ncbi:MAG: hypothetical protein DMG35_16185 [Acidobacteria bacterium]|nr:MAG: hypothetical protein AUH86_18090 [Acidobacteria bacterium 13_1_40CM_4_58_4]PYT58871.1 MAG: hypothetical protein DMG35_16185 [Acidobacteriota bacterium]
MVLGPISPCVLICTPPGVLRRAAASRLGPRERVFLDMRVFRGLAILLALVSIAFGVFIPYDSLARQVAATPGQTIAGALFCLRAIALLCFVSRPALQ